MGAMSSSNDSLRRSSLRNSRRSLRCGWHSDSRFRRPCRLRSSHPRPPRPQCNQCLTIRCLFTGSHDVKNILYLTAFLAATALVNAPHALAGQAPGAASDPDLPISHRDRVYAAEQFSNTVSVTDPVDNKLLGVIRLGDPTPGNLSPLYRGQLLVHGMGFSPDHRTIAVVSIGSNSVTFIDTATNAVKHTTYVGRSPHEAFFSPDGKEVWVTVRGENYVAVLDGTTY